MERTTDRFPKLSQDRPVSRQCFLGLHIPLWLHKRLVDRADAIGVSVSALVVDLLEANTDAAHEAGEKEPAWPTPSVG